MVQFKLQHRGLVRKVTFKNVDEPSWHELSWKIGDVCNIPHAAVALTYLDPDGDKITISSQAELKEYYSSLDEDDIESGAPHKFIVRNLNDGIPDPDAADPREDMFLMRDAQTMAASTVGGGSQWGFNPEDEAERDPTKLRLSGYSTFADALSPLAGSATEPEEDRDSDPPVVGGFGAKPPSPAPAKSSGGGWSLPVFGAWGKSSTTTNNNNTNNNPPRASSPAADPLAKSSNPWAIPPAPANNDPPTNKPPTWLGASATSPTSGMPWGAPASIATGVRPGLKSQGVSPSSIPAPNTTQSARTPSQGPPARPSTLVPPPVAPTVHMDSMVADRASSYAASPAVTATIPKSGKKSKKRMTHREREAERAREEDARRAEEDRLAREEDERYEEEEARYEEQERRAMEAEAKRERDENARFAAEAAAQAAVQEQRRNEEHKRQKAEEEQRQRRASFQRHQSQMSQESDWQHVQDQSPEQEDEEAYRARIQASIANVFGTSPSAPQPPPPPPQQQQQQPRQRKSSTRSKGKESNGKSKVYPPTPAPKKFFDSDLASERGGQSGLNVPTTPGYGQHTPGHSAPPTPGYGPSAASSHGTNGNTAQVCNDVADLLGSFGRILDSEPDLLDAIREAFAHGPAPGALNAEFGKRNLSPEMVRIVSSVDDLLTKILPNRPAMSPYTSNNMELEPRIPTPSVTPTPVNPAEPEFGVPPTEYGGFEFANRGRQQGVPVINVPRPKYPASSITREGYSTGTTPPGPSQSGYGYATSPYPSGSPDRSAARSRSRPPPGEFEIVPPSRVPPQARMVVPPPVVPGDETEDSPMTPDVSRGFTRQSVHENGLVLAGQNPSGAATKADMETARQHYKSQRELYKLEKAERKKEMEERAAAKAERKRAKAAASADPKIADLTNQLQDIGIPQRPYEAERRYIENPYENPRTSGAYPGSSRASTVYAEGLGQVTLVPTFATSSAVTAPVSPVHEDAPQSFDRVRRRRQSLNNASPERYSHSHAPPSVGRTESYHGLQPDAYPGAAHHAPPYIPAPPPQQDLAKRVALKLTEMGYTPQKYPSLPAIVGHRIRPVMNTHGVNESELAYHIVQDLFKYTGQT